LCFTPQDDAEYLQAAQEVLEQHWGLFEYNSEYDVGEFVWYATKYDILDQAVALVKQHDPEFARIELGV
jgi:hypothetical protein